MTSLSKSGGPSTAEIKPETAHCDIASAPASADDPSHNHRRHLSRREAETNAARLLGKITAAYNAGAQKKLRYLVTVYLSSASARLIAAHEAWRRMSPSTRPPKKVIKRWSLLNAWQGTQEPVKAHWKPKKSNPNNFRSIKDFGYEHRVLQCLVDRLLRQIADLHDDQFGLKGVHAAINRVVAAMTAGYVHAQEVDIVDCYPSFKAEQLETIGKVLPLPEEVIRKVLTCAHLNLTAGNYAQWFDTPAVGEDWSDMLAGAQLGIPQGSVISPLLLEIVLAPVFCQLPPIGVKANYADNSLVMGKKQSDVTSISLALRSALKNHPAGCFQSKVKIFKPGEPIDFLGHQLISTKSGVRITPTPDNLARFHRRIGMSTKRIYDPEQSTSARKREVAVARRFIRGWAASFKLCQGIEKDIELARGRIMTASKAIV